LFRLKPIFSLKTEQYCSSERCGSSPYRRYRPAARHAEPIDTSASHVGFSASPDRGSRHE
jgi:hypothetical protein